jgi:hypothetical protein
MERGERRQRDSDDVDDDEKGEMYLINERRRNASAGLSLPSSLAFFSLP